MTSLRRRFGRDLRVNIKRRQMVVQVKRMWLLLGRVEARIKGVGDLLPERST
jgi:hypothetical protein